MTHYTTAPDFTLFDTERNPVSLADFRGTPVLLLFFPAAFTSVCTAELCGVRDAMSQYSDLGVQPIGISVDSLFTLKKYKESESLNFPLLSDFNKEVSQAYGAYYEEFAFGMKGVSKRAAILIDGEGRVRYSEVLDNAGEQPDFEAVRRAIAGLEADIKS